MVDLRQLFDVAPSSIIIRLIAAITIIFIGLVAARVLSRIIQRLLHELEVNRILKEQAGVKIPVEEFVGSLVKYVVYFIAIVMALTQLGLKTIVFYILLVMLLLILVIFVVLAFKDFIPNMTAGFFIHQKRLVKKGDFIKVGDVEGRVVAVGLVETQIKAKNGDIIYVPNAVMTKNLVVKKKG